MKTRLVGDFVARTPFALETFARLWRESGKWNRNHTGYVFDDYASYAEVRYWAQNLSLAVTLTARGSLEVERCHEIDSLLGLGEQTPSFS